MDFVFMLTKADRTVADALAVLDDIRLAGLRHIGCKDVGVSPDELAAIHERIKELGATSYLEVVTTSAEASVESARVARDLGFDRLLGGTQVEAVMALVAGTHTQYLPFPGRPFDHPTRLAGSVEDVVRDCKRYRALGAAGVDLLAYRATEAEPIALVRAAREALDGGTLLVAGGVHTPEQVRALKASGVDAFTVGSAAFDGSFDPGAGSLRSQLRAVLDACA